MTIDETVAPILYEDGAGAGAGAPIWSAASLPWRLAEVAAAGALAGVLMILGWLGLRPDLTLAVAHPFFWIKAGYPAVIAVLALVTATWIARCRTSGLLALAGAAALAGAMLIAALVQALGMTAGALATLYWPNAAICVGNILVIAAPILAITVAGLRDVDLEQPGITGFACGLFCGGVAAAVDGLHCWQETYAFVSPWFTLAMLLSGAAGAGAVKLLARRRQFPQAAE